jgi:hypothetical protein
MTYFNTQIDNEKNTYSISVKRIRENESKVK